MGTLAVRSGWGILSRTAWLCALRDSISSFNSSCKQEVEEKADVGVIGNEGKYVCTFRDKSHGCQRYAPYLGFVWWGKATWHDSRVHSAAGKLAVAGKMHQVERHGCTHSIASSSNSSSGRSHGLIRSRCFVSRFFFGRATYRGRGVQVWSS